jgi:hypothetical protein
MLRRTFTLYFVRSADLHQVKYNGDCLTERGYIILKATVAYNTPILKASHLTPWVYIKQA